MLFFSPALPGLESSCHPCWPGWHILPLSVLTPKLQVGCFLPISSLSMKLPVVFTVSPYGIFSFVCLISSDFTLILVRVSIAAKRHHDQTAIVGQGFICFTLEY